MMLTSERDLPQLFLCDFMKIITQNNPFVKKNVKGLSHKSTEITLGWLHKLPHKELCCQNNQRMHCNLEEPEVYLPVLQITPYLGNRS